MFTVSLTSIPPRFSRLGACLESLLAQERVDRVVLTLPYRYTRFPDSFDVPKLPQAVQLLRCRDIGPASKILPLASQSEPDAPILYCDDDWTYADGWARGFLAAHHTHSDRAIAASTFYAARIGAPQNNSLVAQGFAGVLLTPQMLPKAAYDVPKAFQAVDDIWLSGMLALNGTPIETVSHLRRLAKPSLNEASPLQAGPSRAKANTACVVYLRDRFEVWSRPNEQA